MRESREHRPVNPAVVRRLLVPGLALAIGAAVLGTGCGGAPAPPPPSGSPAELAWIDNAAGLIDQLRDHVLVSASGGADIATALAVLDDQSSLLPMLMANVAFGSCTESLHNVGVPNRRLRPVETTLASACRILQRASRLFTRAETRSDPQALLASSRTTLKASPLLQHAKALLDAIRASPR